MTSLLSQAFKTSERKRPRKAFIYGPPGIGKSTWASCAIGTIFLPIEDGLRNLDVVSLPLATSYGQVLQSLWELSEMDHEYTTLAIDSADWLETLIHQNVAAEAGKTDISEIGYGKGYDAATAKWNVILQWLDSLTTKRNMMIILIGHSKVEKYSDPRTEPYDRYSPRLHKTSAAVLQEWADEVLFANYKTFVKTTDTGFNKTTTRGIGTGERVLYTTERPSYVAKNKLGSVGMPDELPLVFADYWKYASLMASPPVPVRIKSPVAVTATPEDVPDFASQAAEKF